MSEDSDRLLPEQRARVRIDAMLEAAGWVVQDYKAVNLYAGTGVAVRELVTNAGPADYVLFVNRQAVGVIEAKKKGTTLSGVEWQTVKYQTNVPDELPAYLVDRERDDGSTVRCAPYAYESTGDETWFTVPPPDRQAGHVDARGGPRDRLQQLHDEDHRLSPLARKSCSRLRDVSARERALALVRQRPVAGSGWPDYSRRSNARATTHRPQPHQRRQWTGRFRKPADQTRQALRRFAKSQDRLSAFLAGGADPLNGFTPP